MIYKCLICNIEVLLLYRGNTDPRVFFVKGGEYAIAEGSRGEKLDVYQCPKCGLGFSPNDLTQEELSGFYAGQSKDEEYLKEDRGRRITFRKILRRIEEYRTGKGKILDFGAGPGFFLDEARKIGWEIYGCESADWAKSYALENFGIELVADDAVKNFPDDFFDVITLFDVIEHVKYPSGLLAFLSKKLKKGGFLVITTPRFESLTRKILGIKWYFMFPAHLWYFTQSSLETILKNAGFEPVDFHWQVFRFSLRYYLLRLAAFIPFLSKIAAGSVVIPYTLGEEFEVYARKV